MKILNIGSLNIDDVYRMDHFVMPGETQTSLDYNQFFGGKGMNQTIALALAGADVSHAGKIGRDGLALKERLQRLGVNTDRVLETEVSTGRAIIQVNREGENSIILHSGANRTFTPEDIDGALDGFKKGDILLLQNEINRLEEIIHKAWEKGLLIALNPAPMDETINKLPLDKIGIFIVNEIEGEGLTGESDPEKILDKMSERFPRARIFLTLGSRGVIYSHDGKRIKVPAVKVKAVDTTAAGDTFIGYLLAGLSEKMVVENALNLAVKAAAVTVTRPGASDSIPSREEIEG